MLVLATHARTEAEWPTSVLSIIPDQKYLPTEPNVQVTFRDGLSLQDIVEGASRMLNPHVYLWYIGSMGFRTGASDFYKGMLTFFVEKKIACRLYDLTAWGAFADSKLSITNSNSNVERINRFALEKIMAIKSCDFFSWLVGLRDGPLADYVKLKVLKRDVIFEPSKLKEDVSIKLGSIFKENCPALSEKFEDDAAKAYSAVQYIEGFYLIEQVVQTCLDQKEINVVFALPNDESKYYGKGTDSFAEDLQAFLKAKFGDRLASKNINIYFYSFNFRESPESDNINDRPYNTGSTIKKAKADNIVIQEGAYL